MSKSLIAALMAGAMMIGPAIAGDVSVSSQGVHYGQDQYGHTTIGNWTVGSPIGLNVDDPDVFLSYGPDPGFTIYCHSNGGRHYSIDTAPTATEVPDGPATINIVVNRHRRTLAGHGEYGIARADLSKADVEFLATSYSGADTAEAFATVKKDCGQP